MKFSKDSKLISNVVRLRDIPKPKPGEILIMPESNKMLDSDIIPYTNVNNRVDWVANIPKTEGSYRSCPGGTDLMAFGLTIPMWADFRCRPSVDGTSLHAEFAIGSMLENQYAGRIDPFQYTQTFQCPYTEVREKSIEKVEYLKLVNPFLFRTAKGYSTIITGSLLNPSPEFDVIPGIVNTDYYHTLNIVINVKQNKEFYISKGTPIAQLIVVKRSENIKSIILGDESVFKLHKDLGFGSVWSPGSWRRGKYKKEQYKWDK